jgi:hypothetical protein
VDKVDQWAHLGIRDSTGALQKLNAGQETVAAAFETVQLSISSTTTAAISVASDVFMIAADHPGDALVERYEIRDPCPFFDGNDVAELESLLSSVDTQLAVRRRGAWETFHSGTADCLAQAAHSMRDVLGNLISKYASNRHVEVCDWWLAREQGTAQEEVSLRDRLRLLMYGPTLAPPDGQELHLLEAEIAEHVDRRELLINVAHGSTKASSTAVETAMKGIESLMLLILRRRKAACKDAQPGA